MKMENSISIQLLQLTPMYTILMEYNPLKTPMPLIVSFLWNTIHNVLKLTLVNTVSWEPEGHYWSSKMFHWEPEGHYCCSKYIAIAPFWFSMEHLWSAITPFWLSTDDTIIVNFHETQPTSFQSVITGRCLNPLSTRPFHEMWSW